jgi:hypothetical protein
MKSLILTLDYELYGNGSGNVFKHIIEPTAKILRIADKYNTKITIFFEVIEYWKLKEEWNKGNKMGYDRNPVSAMERQLADAYRNGHDIQLHLHPQWLNAKWTNNGWKVDLSQWRLGDYVGNGDDSLTSILLRGKDTLKAIINDNDYECRVLRAGGYNIQPSENLCIAMKNAGLTIDSSIYPGGKENGNLSRYDYSEISIDRGMWFCDNSLEKDAGNITELLELPIVAFPFVRLKKYLSADRIKSFMNNRKSAKESFNAKVNTSNGGLLNKIKFFFQKEALTWDYCLFTTSMHRQFLKRINRQKERSVFVLVGHPKSFVSERGLIYLLTHTDDYAKVSISQFAKSVLE